MDLSRLINDNGVYLYQDDNFNTINIQLSFNGKVGNREDAVNYVLCKYMMQSNEIYPSINQKMKELYAMDLYFFPQKIGKTSSIIVSADLVSPSIVEDDYLAGAFDFIKNIISCCVRRLVPTCVNSLSVIRKSNVYRTKRN